jgi:hypothetical protein
MPIAIPATTNPMPPIADSVDALAGQCSRG